MEIRSPTPGDLDALLDFFERVPESERTFFKEPVLDRSTVEGWLTTDRGRRGLAFDEDGRVVGYVAVVRLSGWSDHVGDVRLVVDPQRRTQGLGRTLARWALLQAVECGMTKLTVEVVAEQDHAVAMFAALGFRAEGLLLDHVRDHDGVLRDLVLLSHPVADSWSAMETAGIDDALRAPGG
jgi:L-amino acid N-acyltransferase YncA